MHNKLRVSLLQNRFSDYASWMERLQATLEAKGLWNTFCVKKDVPPDESSNKAAYDRHMEKHHDCGWKIVKTTEMSRIVRDEETPFEVLEKLKKMFVGFSLLTCAQQFRALMTMKYIPGSDLLEFIHAMKDGYHTLEISGVDLPSAIRPYVLIMSLDGVFDRVLQPI